MARFIRGMTRGIGVGVLFAAVSLAGSAGVAGAAGVTAPSAKVPKGFRANSISWISPQRGWVLGSVPCTANASGGSGAGCADVIGTTNGGKTWTQTGAVKTDLFQPATSHTGVSEIRFANSAVGWAYGPDLYRTANGGRTWTKVAIPGTGKQVVSLAASASSGYAAVSLCPSGNTSGGCDHKGYTFWRTSKLTGAWTRIRLKTAFPSGLFDNGAEVAVHGKTVYALWSAANLFGTVFKDKIFASINGTSFFARPDPCTSQALTQAVPTSNVNVAILCSQAVGGGQTTKTVFRSTTTGKKDTSAGTPESSGDSPALAASPSGNLAVSAGFAASYISINDNAKKAWTQVVTENDGGLSWNDIVYVSNKEAWIVHEPAEDSCSCALGQVFVTRDGGQHWTQVSL